MVPSMLYLQNQKKVLGPGATWPLIAEIPWELC